MGDGITRPDYLVCGIEAPVHCVVDGLTFGFGWVEILERVEMADNCIVKT